MLDLNFFIFIVFIENQHKSQYLQMINKIRISLQSKKNNNERQSNEQAINICTSRAEPIPRLY